MSLIANGEMTPYYEHNGITIIHGDARVVLPTLAGVDLIFTSPPYNLGNTTGGGFSGERFGHYAAGANLSGRGGGSKWSGGALANGYEAHDDAMPHEEYVAWQHEILRLCWSTLSDSGAIFYNHKPRIFSGTVVLPTAYNPGLPLRQVIIWPRAGGINFSPSFYCPTNEWILVLAKEKFRLKSRGASGVGDTWHGIPQEANSDHPCPFPVALPARAIETVAPRLVADPFCGIGSTLVAAKQAGARAIGIDNSERYCEIAARRLDATPEPLFKEPEPIPEQGTLEL